MGEDSGEKTEEPTPHKLREARKKGQIAKSKDFTSAILLMVSFFMLKAVATNMWEQIVSINTYIFQKIPEEFSASTVGALLKDCLHVFLWTMIPLFGAIFLVAVLIESFQTGFIMSLDPLEPKFSKLNPIEGIKKFFSLKQYVELIKSLIKMFLVIILIYGVLKDELLMVVISQQMSLWQVMAFVGSMVMKVIVKVGILYLIIAFFDYVYQKYEYIKGLKMSKKEIKDEYKRLEGDPMIKQRQRDAARQLLQGRQMGAVPGADVVVTNPVHLALALEYDANKMKAPKVIAKGKRLVAQEIRKIAEEFHIPIIENPPLAQKLYKTTEVDDEVPAEYYKAVAEILAFVYNLKRKRKVKI
jgi:flagellar biosynthesis protein FlhB